MPYLARLVPVSVVLAELSSAGAARDSLRAIAERTRDPRAAVEAQLADARIALAQGCPDARRLVETVITSLKSLRLTLEAARARLLLVGLLMESEPELAALEARAALRSLESSGADREADKARRY